MNASKKYRYGVYRGKAISAKEIQRRIAQSLGWRPTLLDSPRLIGLLANAGVFSAEQVVKMEKPLIADTETLSL